MSVYHWGAVKLAFALPIAAGAAVIAMDPTERVALIVGATAVLTSLIGGCTAIIIAKQTRKENREHFEQLRAGVSEIKVSTDGNFTRMLDAMDKQHEELGIANSRADRAEARTEGDQSREKKTKEGK